MIQKNITLLAGACLTLALFGCPGNPSTVDDTRRFEGDNRPMEAVSLLGRPLYASPSGEDRAKLEADLAAARSDLAAHPGDPEKIVWVGRRLGYLWRYSEAIEVDSRGIDRHYKYAPLYRHRGHRYITLRQFDKAIADLESARRLMAGHENDMEPDGKPNARNIPLTTLGFNVWYHLGVARYMKGDFAGADAALSAAMQYVGGHDDNLVAVANWRYMCLRRLGRDSEAAKLLEPIGSGMDVIENKAYLQLLLMYKKLLQPADLLATIYKGDLDSATLGYGVGNWFLYNGDRAKAAEMFEQVVSGPFWPAFGYIACEVELSRTRPYR